MKSKLLSLIALASLWGNLAHAEILPAGALDPTFGADKNGLVRTARPNEADVANASVIQSDGKIIVVGTSQVNGADKNFFLTRYNPDGTIDTTFGAQGFVIHDMSQEGINSTPNGDDEINAVALEGNQIVVAGYVTNPSGDKDPALARFNEDGSFDRTFADNGINRLGTPDEEIATAIAIQPNQKIIVVGRSIQSNTDEDVWVTEYTLNGQTAQDEMGNDKGTTIALDLLFKQGIGTNNIDLGNAVQIQSDGKIVIAGSASSFPMLLRLNADLTQDATFGQSNGNTHPLRNQDGLLVFNVFGTLTGSFQSVEIHSDGKILSGGDVNSNSDKVLLLNRCGDTDCATVDSNFGNLGFGLVLDNFTKDSQGNPGTQDHLSSLKLQSDGKIVITGIASPLLVGTGSTKFATSRYNADGTLDTSFATNGIALTAFDNAATANSTNALIQPANGRIVVVGNTLDQNLSAAPSLIRYFAQATDPNPPAPAGNPNNGGGGCSVVPFGNFNLFAFALWLIPIGLFGWRRMRKVH